MALKELLDRLFEEEFAKLKEADEDVVTSEEEVEVKEPTPVEDPKSPTFEDDPLEYILFKYPTLTKTLEDLLSKNFRDYITGVYVIAPVPTTFKVLLHNNQSFYLIYMGRSWVAKVSGKKYYLLNLGEEERAKVAISNLLMMGKVKEDIQGPDQVSTESGDETAPAEEAPSEQEPTETEPA